MYFQIKEQVLSLMNDFIKRNIVIMKFQNTGNKTHTILLQRKKCTRTYMCVHMNRKKVYEMLRRRKKKKQMLWSIFLMHSTYFQYSIFLSCSLFQTM